MVKCKVISLVAVSLVVLSMTQPQSVHATDEYGGQSSSVEGSCEATSSCASDEGGNSSAGNDQQHPYVPDGDGGDSDVQLEEDSEEEDDYKLEDYACEDQHKSCPHWSELGECSANPNYMTVYCRRSCELCPDQQEQK
jgi:hypothetical protein